MIERTMNRIYTEMEHAREKAFQSIWSNQIDAVFSDVAEYYDRANVYATLGLIDRLRRRFLSTMDYLPGAKVLDVCAGTNVIGIDLFSPEAAQPGSLRRRLKQGDATGRQATRRRPGAAHQFGDLRCPRAAVPGRLFRRCDAAMGDAASACAQGVFSEIHRASLGGHFDHCDMLRPQVKLVEKLYFLYLNKVPDVGFARIRWERLGCLECRSYFV